MHSIWDSAVTSYPVGMSRHKSTPLEWETGCPYLLINLRLFFEL